SSPSTRWSRSRRSSRTSFRWSSSGSSTSPLPASSSPTPRPPARGRMARAEIGVFGGSGFYSFLEDIEQVEVETPYGKPSAPFTIGDIGGKSVAFLPRHGLNHELPPHAI